MSSTTMTVSARRDSKELASVTLTKGCEPVFVGRSSSCLLKLPADDHSVSAVHAKIFWKGSSLMIEDAGSRNGIFKDGQPLKRAAKMVPDSLYAVGSCILSVAGRPKGKGSKLARKYHRLEFLNGDESGRIVDIVPRDDGKEFDIGLDPNCSINLRDMLVSRRHAVLKTNAAGECWIEDLGSRNGTFVNGERLTGNERLLRDGDIISVAFFEFRFLDRSVVHTRAHMLFKLGVVMVTGCVLALGYIAWKASRKPVQSYLAIARRAAAQGDFVAAKNAVSESRDARDFSDYHKQIDAFANQLEQWKVTRESWLSVQKDVAAHSFDKASRILDGLISGPLESWGWDPDGMAETKRLADLASNALHLYLNGRDAVDSAARDATSDADIRVRASIGPIESFLQVNAEVLGTHSFLAGVSKSLDSLLSDLTIIRSGYVAIDDSISKVSAKTPDFRIIYDDFKRIAESTNQSPAVCSYARQQLVICGAFVGAQDFLDDELASLLRLDFAGVRKMADEIKLPSQELCLRHSRYSDVRSIFAERHALFQKENAQIQLMIEGLNSIGITEKAIGDDIKLFGTSNMEAALSFDCLSKRQPNVRRPAPVGMYDTLFGIEYTYESLQALPNAFNGRNIRAMNFLPRCVAARQAFNRVEAFVQYLDKEDRADLKRGNLGKYYARCIGILTVREQLLRWLKEYKGTERGEIVANFYSDFFSPRPSDVAKRMLRDRFNALRRELIALDERYKLETDPERQIAIRNEILSKGIPGDPILHSKWAQMVFPD